MTHLLRPAVVALLLLLPAAIRADDGNIPVTLADITFFVPQTWLVPSVEPVGSDAVDQIELVLPESVLAEFYGDAAPPEQVRIVLYSDPAGEWQDFWVDDRLERARSEAFPVTVDAVSGLFQSIDLEEIFISDPGTSGKSATRLVTTTALLVSPERGDIAIAGTAHETDIDAPRATGILRVYRIAATVRHPDQLCLALIHVRAARALTSQDLNLIDWTEGILNDRAFD